MDGFYGKHDKQNDFIDMRRIAYACDTVWTAGKSIYEMVNIHEMFGNQFNVYKSTHEKTNIQHLKHWANRTYSIHVSESECLYSFEQHI